MPEPSAYLERHCRVSDPAVFFPNVGPYHEDEAYDPARRICAGCPWSAPCLERALADEGSLAAESRFGFYAGLTPGERASLARRRAKERRG